MILKATPGSRRWQHMARGLAADGQESLPSTESNYTIIFGSHRNTSLKVEKNGHPCSTVSTLASSASGLLAHHAAAASARTSPCSRPKMCILLQIKDIPQMQLHPAEFRRFWIEYDQGAFRMGCGAAGYDELMQWQDEHPIEGIKHVGLAAWDKFMAYRNIRRSAAVVHAPQHTVSRLLNLPSP